MSRTAALPAPLDGFCLSLHARERMVSRSISAKDMARVLEYGRCVSVRGAEIYVIGRKEVERYRREGVDLAGLDGLQVVANDAGLVYTVYRNRDFRGLKERRRHARAR